MSTAQRTCSICHQPGHNKRTCPQATGRNVALATKVHTKSAPVTQPIEATDCPICMDPLAKTNCCTTSCGHQFCLKCFVTHTQTKSSCPVCRADIPGANPQRRPAAQGQYPWAAYRESLSRARANIQQQLNASRAPYGFSIFIQNHSNNPVDIYWQPPTDVPLATHRNIAAGTVRRVHVGGLGDRFSLVASVPGLPAQQPTPTGQNPVPNQFDFQF